MPEARSQIGFEQVGIGTALKHNRLVVPPNQREYAWTEDEVTQLFQDFNKAMNEGAAHFLGTIVTIPRTDGTLEVVDGQQRLATTALLLTAIRDDLGRKNEPMIADSVKDFLTTIDREARDRVPRLQLNVDDNDLFKSIVSAENGFNPDSATVTRKSNELLVAAYKEAQKQVRGILASVERVQDHGDFLNRWVSFVEHNALVVLLKVPDDADAYRMFETLNDRGLRTSQADLVKNYLFSKSGDRFNEVQTKWSYMRGALESLDDEDITINFLRQALVLKRGYLSAGEVYEAVQADARAPQSTVTFVSHLESLGSVYVATFNPEHERWNDYQQEVRRAIEVFNLLNIKPLRALLLAIAAKMTPRETTEAYAFLVSLGVRLLIAATIRSGSVETPVSAAARDVFAGKLTTASELKAQLKSLTPSDAQFREAFRGARSTTAKLARYYLRSLERAAKDEAEPWYLPQNDPAFINLEHVLPERPGDAWPHVSDEDVGQYAKRFGNLALLRVSDNSELKSKSFAEKKPVYEASPYILTSQIAEADEWTPETIVERQERLADLAVKTWPTS